MPLPLPILQARGISRGSGRVGVEFERAEDAKIHQQHHWTGPSWPREDDTLRSDVFKAEPDGYAHRFTHQAPLAERSTHISPHAF